MKSSSVSSPIENILPADEQANHVYRQIREGKPEFTNSSTSLQHLEFTPYQQERLLITACKQGYMPILEQLVEKYGPELLNKKLLSDSTTALEQVVLEERATLEKRKEIILYLFEQGIIPTAVKQQQIPQPTDRTICTLPPGALKEPDLNNLLANQERPREGNNELLLQDVVGEPNNELLLQDPAEEANNELPYSNDVGASSSEKPLGFYPLYFAVERGSRDLAVFLYTQQLAMLRARKPAHNQAYLCVDTHDKTPFQLSEELNNPEMLAAFYMFEENRLSILERLIGKYKTQKNFKAFFTEFIEQLFYHGDKESIAYLINQQLINQSSIINNKTLVELTVYHSQAELFQWLTEDQHFSFDTNPITELAASCGALNVLKFINDTHPIEESRCEHLLIIAIKQEQWKVAKWLGECLKKWGREEVQVRGQIILSTIFHSKNTAAAQQYNNPKYHSLFAQDFTFKLGQICLEENFDYKLPFRTKSNSSAVNLLFLKNVNQNLTCSPFLFGILIGNISVTQMMLAKHPELLAEDSLLPFLTALFNEHFHLVESMVEVRIKKLKQNRYTEYQRLAIESIKYKAPQPALDWLITQALNRDKKSSRISCLFETLVYQAIITGQKEILIWLLEQYQRFKLSLPQAESTVRGKLVENLDQFVLHCIRAGDLESLQWLMNYFNIPLSTLAAHPSLAQYLIQAARKDQLNVFQWLIEEQKLNVNVPVKFPLIYDEISYISPPNPINYAGYSAFYRNIHYIEVHSHPPLVLLLTAWIICEGHGRKIVNWLIETHDHPLFTKLDIKLIFKYCENLYTYLLTAAERNQKIVDNPLNTMPEVFADLIFIYVAQEGPENSKKYLTVIWNYMSAEAKPAFCQRFETLLESEKYAQLSARLRKKYVKFLWPEIQAAGSHPSNIIDNIAKQDSSSSNHPQPPASSLPFLNKIGDNVEEQKKLDKGKGRLMVEENESRPSPH